MFSWKPKFKFPGKVFAILRKRPDADEVKSDIIPRPLGSAPTSRADDPQSNAASNLAIKAALPGDDSIQHATVHPSGSFFTGAKNCTLNGGEFYTVGGNLTIQRTDPREIVEMAVACAMEIHAQMNGRRLEEMMGRSQLPRSLSVGLVYIMDAAGRQHGLTMNMARSFEQFNRALRVLFEPETPQDKILHKYMDIGAYDLTIDDGNKQTHLHLTSQEEWSSIVQRDTTIVMNIVMAEELDYEKHYQCLFCPFWNEVEKDFRESSMDCQSCKKRFQITTSKFRLRTNDVVETVPTIPDHERVLIHNIHLKLTLPRPIRTYFERFPHSSFPADSEFLLRMVATGRGNEAPGLGALEVG